MDDASESPGLKIRLRREMDRSIALWREYWQFKWFRITAYVVGAILLGWLMIWLLFGRNLPSVDRLKTYEPPLPTYVRGYDGAPVHSYARERRVQLRYDEFPPLLIRAYLAAEDRTFFEHSGLDYPGIVAAIFTNMMSSGRPVGASTITQQVAKNLLLTNEASYVRKVKEAILAKRIESALTKQQILELYLNQIDLGRRSFGVQAAARAYFGKDVGELQLHEMAYLAILPKGPSNYRPERFYDRALARRNWVLGGMLKNEFITRAQHDDAVGRPLGVIPRVAATSETIGGYYTEELRRQLIAKFGENSDGGRNPFSVYDGGLWVRSSLDPKLQQYAESALRDGLVRYDRGKGWSGPIRTLEIGNNWAQQLASANLGAGYPDWRVAVVLSKGPDSVRLGFADGRTGMMPASAATMPRSRTAQTAFSQLKQGDVIAVKAEGGIWVLRNIPEISGGMVVENPHTGQVLAMQGGFDSRIASYNRATQAERQPGSSFKPFVYAAALDGGMTPATIIVDGPFCVFQSARLGQKCFRNFTGGGSGPHTMRWGVEQSRNLMTVRAASQTGMDKVVKMASAVGISDPGKNYPQVLSIALGAGETTVSKMVNAYAILVRNGIDIRPTMIDFVQDRYGRVRFRADTRPCNRCNMAEYDGKPMPRPAARTKQVMDPLTAYQVVHILEGVVQRGTAVGLRDMNRPLFGKTGTTSGPTNVWFVGGSPDLVAGLYMGYDTPRSMGGYAQGGTVAVPIFRDFAQKALKDVPIIPFRAPPGIRMIRIDRASGKRVFGTWPTSDPKAPVIWEAFKPESEPRRSIRRDELTDAKKKDEALPGQNGPAANQRDTEFLQREGGIY
ncbi:MAG: transglycosylase domain-containing protein [Sphingomonadales bacterium]|nr:transglycosylase domain-containing protein [Sphingomonadales bacterium]